MNVDENSIANFIDKKIAAPSEPKTVSSLPPRVANEAIIKAFEHAKKLYYQKDATCTSYDAVIIGLKLQGLSWRFEAGMNDYGKMIYTYTRLVKMSDVLKKNPMYYERELASVR